MATRLFLIVIAVLVVSGLALAQETDVPAEVEELALEGVASNADWIPYSAEFDGVEMVLVPAGCFMMGREARSDSKPVHEQCFDAPFWIDRTEVTRAMYAECVADGACEEPPVTDYSNEDDQPVNFVSWFEAQDYCQWRDAQLPTEREWEYAARGPDNLNYPWGNEWVAENVVGDENSGNKTAVTGSKPEGASWVGALDMSGNVFEWTSSIFESYPYDENDGRESNSDADSERVLRGGSFYNSTETGFLAVLRYDSLPTLLSNGLGFRCARSYGEDE